MSLNDPRANRPYRKPRLRCLINGVEIPGCIKASVSNNNFYHADTYNAEFWLYADQNYGAKFWGEQVSPFLISVEFGLLPEGVEEGTPANFQSFILGVADHVEVHPFTGIVTVSGRDLTSNMIDTKIQESFKNKSASDIAIAIAKSHNMTANVVATHDMAGAYYDRDHDQLNDSHFSKTTTEWDLLTYLAQQQDPSYDCYVTGTTLNFVPSQPPNSNPWTIYLGPPEIQGFGYVKFPESNVNDLRLDRSLTLAKDVQVTAESYDPDSGKKIRVVVKSHNTASPGKADPRGTPTQNYILRLHGVNGDTALKRAKQMAEDITKHERLISWSEPGDMNLSPRNLVNVTGTDSSWDQIYYIDSIDRSITVDGGFTMNVRAKNHSTITQTVE